VAPSGPLGIAVAATAGARPRRRVHATLRGGTLTLRMADGAKAMFPAAGSRLVAPDLQAGWSGRPDPRRGGVHAGGPRLVCREMIPGSSILLANVVESRPRSLKVRRQVPGLARRLARALRIIQIVWPEAHREICARTWMVVPIHEPGTVSWSLAARPGISYIHVSGKSLLDLADDLLHENSHHRLHDMQEAAVFLAPGPDTEDVQAFDSPWRGTRRPLHGILHGAYTFLFRAELFRRILRASRDHPRLLAADLGPSGLAFVRRELRREVGMIGDALRDLRRSSAEGLLTPAGARLIEQMSSRYRRVRRS
jgi:HEXXH motif-containing protein